MSPPPEADTVESRSPALAEGSSREGRPARGGIRWGEAGAIAAAFVAGALSVLFSFQSGANSPGAAAVGVLILIALLALRVALAEQPFAGLRGVLGIAVGAMAIFTLWTLFSVAWSDSATRAMTDLDRELIYLLALVFFGSWPRTPRRVRCLVWGLALAMTAVCVAAFVTRVLPDVWSAPPDLQSQRLSYPIGHWNALGLAASFGLIFCLHLASSAREPRAARVLGAAATPVLGATLLLTFSRGALAAAAVGLVAYLVLARPTLALTGLLACVPTTAFAVLTTYHADFSGNYVLGRGYAPLTAAGLAEAHDVALTVAACSVVAALVRTLGLLALDPGLSRLRIGRRVRRRVAWGTAALAAVAVAVGVTAVLLGGALDPLFERAENDPVTQTGDYRDRLFNPGLHRVDQWRVAIDGFKADPLKGSGAGTYQLLWQRDRPSSEESAEAHSLYLQRLAELGVVGGVLSAAVLLLMLGGFARRLGGRERSVFAALLAGGLAWALHSALDYDWQFPALTMWLFAAGGIALARPAGEAVAGRRPRWPVRVVAVLGLLLLAIVPARLGVSHYQLQTSLEAYRVGDCRKASAEARSSISTLGNRPGPYQIQGDCLARSGDPVAGARSIGKAVGQDPGNWRYHYALALVQGLAGTDPRPELRETLVRNPRKRKARTALRRFGSRPATWRRVAKKLVLR